MKLLRALVEADGRCWHGTEVDNRKELQAIRIVLGGTRTGSGITLCVAVRGVVGSSKVRANSEVRGSGGVRGRDRSSKVREVRGEDEIE